MILNVGVSVMVTVVVMGGEREGRGEFRGSKETLELTPILEKSFFTVASHLVVKCDYLNEEKCRRVFWWI